MKTKKHFSVFFTFVIILQIVLLLTVNIKDVQAEVKGKWLLVEVKDFTSAEAVKQANENMKGVYAYSAAYGRGSYSNHTSYVGRSENHLNPPSIQGESLSVNANWSLPPRVIEGGQEVKLNVSMKAANRLSFYDFGAASRALIDEDFITPGSCTAGRRNFADENGNYMIMMNNRNYDPISKELTAIMPSGYEGQRKAIIIEFGTNKMGTVFIYEWKTSGKPIEIEDYETQIQGDHSYEKDKTILDKLIDEKELSNKYTDEDEDYLDENGNFIDSGIRFSDFNGEVMIRPFNDEDAWDMAELDMVINVGDHIKLGEESMAVLGLTDMTQFEMGPETEIIISSPKQKHKIVQVGGKILINIKKMLQEGTLDVEMSQGISGARGTTFVCEEIDGKSTLKVIEGTVEFTGKYGAPIDIIGGQKISATNGLPSTIKNFSPSEELLGWSSATQTYLSEVFQQKGIKLNEPQIENYDNLFAPKEEIKEENTEESASTKEETQEVTKVESNNDVNNDEMKPVRKSLNFIYIISGGVILIGGLLLFILRVNKK